MTVHRGCEFNVESCTMVAQLGFVGKRLKSAVSTCKSGMAYNGIPSSAPPPLSLSLSLSLSVFILRDGAALYTWHSCSLVGPIF